jgi:hypothetical protein
MTGRHQQRPSNHRAHARPPNTNQLHGNLRSLRRSSPQIHAARKSFDPIEIAGGTSIE